MKLIFNTLLFFACSFTTAQGVYPPAAGMEGTTAIYKDSSAFVEWVSRCTVIRGLQDISQAGSDTTSVGSAANVIGKADGNKIVSLGDGGEAIVEFNGSIFDGQGPDFAVFENAFNASFLELAFVEVSSDGLNYVRFPAHSLTDTNIAIGSFGSLEASNINNLAGKYQANYGTPFDLAELAGINGLDIQNITHIKIIDVVGSLDNSYATKDSAGNKINDQYPTPFPSGGFDLDAVGVIHLNPLGLETIKVQQLSVYPNPSQGTIFIDDKWSSASYALIDSKGTFLRGGVINVSAISLSDLDKGVYFLQLQLNNELGMAKIIKQ